MLFCFSQQVLYTSQQPRQVKIGVSLPSGATISELRDLLQLDTSIDRNNMLLTEIGESGFMRTFTDAQSVSIITEIDPIYCIEVAQLKDVEEDSTSAYILLCWINVVVKDGNFVRFGMCKACAVKVDFIMFFFVQEVPIQCKCLERRPTRTFRS